MARLLVADAYRDPAARRVVRAYLSDLNGRLVVPRHLRTDILEELEDGLVRAIADNAATGMTPAEAASKATADFGDPVTVAHAFADEAVAAHSRRTAVTLIRTGPVIGALWLGSVVANDLAPPSWAGPWVMLPLVGLALTVGVPAAIVTIAATGRLGMRFPNLQGHAPLAAATAGIAALVVDLTVLGMAVAFVVTAPRGVSWWPVVAVATTASLVRLTFAGRAASRCLRARAVQARL